MELLLVYAGIFFALLYGLHALFRTIRRTEQVTFIDIALVFLTALLMLVAMIQAGMDGLPNPTVDRLVFALGGVILLFGLVLTAIEFFRPQRLKQSRGLLALFSGLLLLIASVAVPFASVYIALPADRPSTAQADGLLPVEVSDTNTPEISAEQQARFEAVLTSLLNIVSEETGLDLDGVLSALDNGQTIAQLVENNDGSVDRVINDVTDLFIEQIQISLDKGEISRMDAASAITFARVGISLAVNNDIRSLARMGQEEAGDTVEDIDIPDENESFFAFLTTTATPAHAETDANTVVAQAPAATETPRPTVTQTPTVTPSPSRTPRPSPTATNTRQLYVSPTPTHTPTLPNPCLAVMNYNVNMRAEPNLDAELLTTVPYEAVVNVYSQNEDSTWWYAQYEEAVGWLSGEFIQLTSSCRLLPVRASR